MKKIIPLILLLIISMLVSTFSVTASAIGDTLKVLDYSNPSSSKIEYTASEFIELLTGEKVSKVEAEYIDSVLGEAFAYSDSVPQKNVEVEYYNNTLTVTAKKFEYKNTNLVIPQLYPEYVELLKPMVVYDFSRVGYTYVGEIVKPIVAYNTNN